jgi:hypothetical protein
MKILKGRFEHANGRPMAEGILTLKLSQDAKAIATGEQVPKKFETVLDENGEIKAGTMWWANDELKPAGTYYLVEAWHGVPCWRAWLKIVGTSPINLNELEQEEHAPLTAPEDVEPPAPEPPPAARKAGVSYCGFFGGVVYPPPSNAAADSLIAGADTFDSFEFALPFRAIINRVTVVVEDTCAYLQGKVVVKLRNLSNGKEYAASINASSIGKSTGEFPEELTLAAGDYSMSWAASLGVKVRGLALNEFCGRRNIILAHFSA